MFQAIKRIVEASPLLMREAKITADKITFPGVLQRHDLPPSHPITPAPLGQSNDLLLRRAVGRTPPSAASACGMRWSRRRRGRSPAGLTVTYAGFRARACCLKTLYKRGLAQPQVGPSLYAGDGLLMAWHHEPIAPWQTESWLAEMRRSLRPNQYPAG